MPIRLLPPLACSAITLALPLLAAAQSSQGAPPLWEVGAFGVAVSQQAYPGADQNIARGLALPYVIYRGQFLRADRDTVGLRALRSPRYEIDIGFAGSFGSSADDIDARRGMADLGTLVEFGPRLKWNLGQAAGGRWRVELPLRGVFDLSDGFAHRGMAFEPELRFERRSDLGFAYGASVGAVLADSRLAGTLYTVRRAEANVLRPAYDARSGLAAWRVGVNASREITPDWRAFGFVRIDSVAGAANEDSPLVRRTTGASVGVGLAWTWMRSQARAAD